MFQKNLLFIGNEKMSTTKLESFLKRRESLVGMLEIIVALYVEIGNKLSPLDSAKRKQMGHSIDDDGNIYQFFAFTQKILVDMLYMTFITIVGEYDPKKHLLKDWDKVVCSSNQVIQLKEIRNRYKVARNKHICHIDDSFDGKIYGVAILKVNSDIEALNNIFNSIRRANGLPPIVRSIPRSPEYSVLGLNKIFELLFDPKLLSTLG